MPCGILKGLSMGQVIAVRKIDPIRAVSERVARMALKNTKEGPLPDFYLLDFIDS